MPEARDPWERLLEKVEEDENGCWLYQGALNESGYGRFAYHGIHGYGTDYAHRAAFHLANGWLPEGYEQTIDHLCRVHRCVNPDHLEVVSPKEQMARSPFFGLRTTCIRGHALTEDNVYLYHGHRRCRSCWREEKRETYQVNRDEMLARKRAAYWSNPEPKREYQRQYNAAKRKPRG